MKPFQNNWLSSIDLHSQIYYIHGLRSIDPFQGQLVRQTWSGAATFADRRAAPQRPELSGARVEARSDLSRLPIARVLRPSNEQLDAKAPE